MSDPSHHPLKTNPMHVQDFSAYLEEKKAQIQKDIKANVEKQIIPLLNRLKRRSREADKKLIFLLQKNLEHLTSSFGRKISEPSFNLSPREIEICGMIRNGLSTKEIAEILNTSVRTIDNHRNRIRKKLNISKKRVNLTLYLQST